MEVEMNFVRYSNRTVEIDMQYDLLAFVYEGKHDEGKITFYKYDNEQNVVNKNEMDGNFDDYFYMIETFVDEDAEKRFSKEFKEYKEWVDSDDFSDFDEQCVKASGYYDMYPRCDYHYPEL